MSTKNQTPLSSVLSQGWTAWMLLLLMMVSSQVVMAAATGDFSEFATHPGPKAWRMLVVFFTVYTLMSVLVRVVQAAWFRWLNAVLTIVVTLFMLMHNVQHVVSGSGVSGVFSLLDYAHHGIGVLMSVLAIRWARQAHVADALPALDPVRG